jgi:hypothetical protein
VGTNEREFGLLCGDSFGIYPDRDAAFIGKVYRWGYVGVEVNSRWIASQTGCLAAWLPGCLAVWLND